MRIGRKIEATKIQEKDNVGTRKSRSDKVRMRQRQNRTPRSQDKVPSAETDKGGAKSKMKEEPQAEAEITGLSKQKQTGKTAQEPATKKEKGRATGRSKNHWTQASRDNQKRLLECSQNEQKCGQVGKGPQTPR